MKRRFFAMLLSLAMLFTLAPTAFAAETTERSESQTETPELTNPATSGTSGGIAWKVKDGVLTISATSSVEDTYTVGQMKDYTSPMGEKVTEPTGWYALKDSITEIKIEEGVTYLGNYAFSYLTKVVKVNIPASITSLGDSIFRGDTALTTVEWASGFNAPEIRDTDSNSAAYTGNYVPTSMFDGCTSLGKDKELSAWLPASFTGVGCAAFRGTQFTVNFDGWNTLNYIGAYGFAGMPNLDSFTLSNEITLGLRGENGGASNAFNSSGLKTLTVADGIKAIPNGMFNGCEQLSSVALADSVTTISTNAFFNTTALKNINLKNVQTINSYAFWGSGLTDLVLPESVKQVKERAFEACTSLKKVTINAAELTLDNTNTFAGCSLLNTVVTSADSEIKALNASAFGPDSSYGSKNYKQAPVKSIEINGTVTTLNFSALSSLTSLTINGKNTWSGNALPSGFENLVINGDSWSVGNYQFQSGAHVKHLVVSANVVPADVISDNTNTKKAEAAFRSNSNLETAQFTGTTVKLQDKMFLGCTGLKWLDLSAVNTLTVGSGCFGDDNNEHYEFIQGKPNKFNKDCVIYAKDAKAAQTLRNNLGTKGIVLVVNGGTVDTAAENAGFSAVTKSGYTAKWYTAENFSGGAVTTPMAGNTYYAEWTMADSISLTSDSQNPVTYGTKVTLTASPVNSSWGYVWYKDANKNGTLELSTDKQINNNKSTLELANVSDSGTYWVLVNDGRSTKTSNAINVTITKANGTASVSMEGWTYGETAKTPVPTSETNGTDRVTYQYKIKDADDNTYSTTVPTNAGSYTVKATFPATDNYKEVTATADFVIAQATHHSSSSSSSNPTYSVTTPSKSENGG
ncbi:MAG: leucine-rich repeat protein, partial [Bacillota bacterium]|nr:leucine-rich repeat protein [Bacillota bacterium]